MEKSQPGFLRQLWSRKAPWYVKAARISLLSAAGFFAVPEMIEQLPGDPLPEHSQSDLQTFFGKTVDLDRVTVHSSSLAEFFLNLAGADAAAFGPTILIREKYRDLLATDADYLQYILAHELGHTYQDARHGPLLSVRVLWEKLANGRGEQDALYFYTLEDGKTFEEYGIEQQASIIADYYNITHERPPLLLENALDIETRDRLYQAVLADFLKERSIPQAPAPVPAA